MTVALMLSTLHKVIWEITILLKDTNLDQCTNVRDSHQLYYHQISTEFPSFSTENHDFAS